MSQATPSPSDSDPRYARLSDEPRKYFADVLRDELIYVDDRRQTWADSPEELRLIKKSAIESFVAAKALAKQAEIVLNEAREKAKDAYTRTRAERQAATNTIEVASADAKAAAEKAEKARVAAKEAIAKHKVARIRTDVEDRSLQNVFVAAYRHEKARLIAEITASHEPHTRTTGVANAEAAVKFQEPDSESSDGTRLNWEEIRGKATRFANKKKDKEKEARIEQRQRRLKSRQEHNEEYARLQSFEAWKRSRSSNAAPVASDKATTAGLTSASEVPDSGSSGAAARGGRPPEPPSIQDQYERERNQFFLKRARESELVGLSLSGGGIRSATFNLGFLQGLADFGLLRHLDYLSTVSGGGYIGCWLRAWIHRERKLDNVEQQLRSSRVEQAKGFRPPRDPKIQELKDEPAPIVNLRTYSSYLAPHRALGSTDSWVLLAIYVRNLLLNQLILIPFLIVLMLVCRLVLLFFVYAERVVEEHLDWPVWMWGYLAISGALIAIGFTWLSLPLLHSIRTNACLALEAMRRRGKFGVGRVGNFVDSKINRQEIKLAYVVWPVVVACVAASWLIWPGIRPRSDEVNKYTESYFKVFESSYPILFRWRHAYFFATAAGLLCIFTGILLLALDCAIWLLGSFCRFGKFKRGWSRLVKKWRGFVFVRRVFAAFIATLIVGALIGLLHGAADQLSIYDHRATLGVTYPASIVVTFGPPTVLLAVCLGVVLWMGVMGVPNIGEWVTRERIAAWLGVDINRERRWQRSEDLREKRNRWLATKSHLDEEREWWASVQAKLMMVAFAWVITFGVVLFSVPLLVHVSPLLRSSALLSWLGTTIVGVVMGSSRYTGKSQDGYMTKFVKIVPWVYIVGLLMFLSWSLSGFIDSRPKREDVANSTKLLHDTNDPPLKIEETLFGDFVARVTRSRTHLEYTDETQIEANRYWSGLFSPKRHNTARDDPEFDLGDTAYKWALLWAGLATVCFSLSLTVGVNTFSLQNLYTSRLVRCYLGASRLRPLDGRPGGVSPNVRPPRRSPNPVTGFDGLDDFDLAALADRHLGEEIAHIKSTRCRSGPGPFLLINTAMNLVQDADLAWQERKATSFVLSPMYCGSDISSYRPSTFYAGNIRLGAAMAISGAAASPNMGYHSSPAVTAMLTTFNVRLGSWLPNPIRRYWTYSEPLNSLVMLIKEVFGFTNRSGKFVYLSDGGHFENLGAYELVHRHCRFIIVCDAGADPNYEFFDLAGLIRKCRIDFGIPIEIDTTPIRPGADGKSKWHCAIGTIRYDAVDPLAAPGTLIYVKSSLTGDEPADVRGYATRHVAFPHQTTANQFFTESQFESYRALGLHVAHELLGEAMKGVEPAPYVYDDAQRRVIHRLFSNLRTIWSERPPDLEKSYLESVKGWVDVNSALRTDTNLRDLSLEFYPEMAIPLATKTDSAKDSARAELLAVGQMVQMMESAFVGLQLDKYHSLPMNRGWMNAFRRWGTADGLRKHWIKIRGEYSQEFVRFCERELNLDPGNPVALPIDQPPGVTTLNDFAGLKREFEQDWPGEDTVDERLDRAVLAPLTTGNVIAGNRLAWLIAVASSTDPAPDQWTGDKYACGLICVEERKADLPMPGYQLSLWIRGAYRNLNIGRRCLDGLLQPSIIPQLAALGTARPLVVQFPEAQRADGNISSQTVAWKSFYEQYGFRREDVPGTRDLYLVLDI